MGLVRMKHGETTALNTFIKYRDELVNQIRSGRMHYDLYCNLIKTSHDFAPEFNRAPHFWNLTLNAHLESFRISLCRVYDQGKFSISLYLWLKLYQDELLSDDHSDEDICDRYHCKPLAKGEIDRDLSKVQNQDRLVKTLTKQRGAGIAHVSAKKIVKGVSAFADYPMKYADWEALLERAERILNRYSILQTGESHSFNSWLHRNQDFQIVLDDIRRASVSKKELF